MNTAPFWKRSNGFAKSIVVDRPASLFTATVYNSAVDTRFLLLFDAAAVPADGTVPLMVVTVPGLNTVSFDFGQALPFAVGIVAVISTTDTILTQTATNDGAFVVTYE